MERGLFIGGVLICGSIALAMILNLSGSDDAAPVQAVPATYQENASVESATPQTSARERGGCRAEPTIEPVQPESGAERDADRGC